MELQQIIEAAWDDRSLLQDKDVKIAIKSTIDDLDRGKKRVAEPQGNDWIVHDWVKKAVILYFPLQKMKT